MSGTWRENMKKLKDNKGLGLVEIFMILAFIACLIAYFAGYAA